MKIYRLDKYLRSAYFEDVLVLNGKRLVRVPFIFDKISHIKDDIEIRPIWREADSSLGGLLPTSSSIFETKLYDRDEIGLIKALRRLLTALRLAHPLWLTKSTLQLGWFNLKRILKGRK